MKKHLILLLSMMTVIFVSGCTEQEIQANVTGGGFSPVSGSTITIQNCKGSPEILQVNDGTEVTFNNADNQAHKIFIDNTEMDLPAKGSIKIIAIASLPKPFTNNYLCDQNWSGAIYIPA